MTAKNFMNVVRFKLKSDYVEKYFEVLDKRFMRELEDDKEYDVA